MKLIASCTICNQIILSVYKNFIIDQDIEDYKRSCSCEIHGPFQEFNELGEELPKDYSNISVFDSIE